MSSNNVFTTLDNGEHLRISKVFSRQQYAFDYVDSLLCHCSEARSSHLKVFSFESISSGQRKFMVATYSDFFRQYYPAADVMTAAKTSDVMTTTTTTKTSAHKHVYEIIRERHPCRAYFDLEYEKEFNPQADGDQLTALWINLVAWKLSESFHLDDIGRDNFIVLDSSTSKKFSKHVIVILPSTTTTTTKTGSSNYDANDDIAQRPRGSEIMQEEEMLFRDNTVVGTMVELILQDITTVFSPGDWSP